MSHFLEEVPSSKLETASIIGARIFRESMSINKEIRNTNKFNSWIPVQYHEQQTDQDLVSLIYKEGRNFSIRFSFDGIGQFLRLPSYFSVSFLGYYHQKMIHRDQLFPKVPMKQFSETLA